MQQLLPKSLLVFFNHIDGSQGLFAKFRRFKLGMISMDQNCPELLSSKVRTAIVQALHGSGGGHYGGALSVVDILLALYRNRILTTESGDKLILSKGHAAIALYAVWSALGIEAIDLSQYGQFGSALQGHPDMLMHPRVDFSTGSLGQGLAVGAGMAFYGRDRGSHVWVVLGDGECQEGQVWEAAMLAARYELTNLHAIVDCNRAQEWGWSTEKSIEQDPLPAAWAKWSAFGWHSTELDGHNHEHLDQWIAGAIMNIGKPSVALAHTRKGRGVASLEAAPEKSHYASLTDEEFKEAILGLEL
jgi:transketolase